MQNTKSITFLEQWREYNRLIKEADDIYKRAAQHHGLSDAAHWILYMLCDEPEPFTQSDLCRQWFFSKQTINSAIGTLLKSGYITLEAAQGNSHRKIICLTAKGQEFCQKEIMPFLELDRASLAALTEEEREQMLHLIQKQIVFFKKGVETLWQ